MTLWRHAEQQAARRRHRRPEHNLLAACCPCGRSIRIAASTLAAAPVLCAACDGKFEAKQEAH